MEELAEAKAWVSNEALINAGHHLATGRVDWWRLLPLRRTVDPATGKPTPTIRDSIRRSAARRLTHHIVPPRPPHDTSPRGASTPSPGLFRNELQDRAEVCPKAMFDGSLPSAPTNYARLFIPSWRLNALDGMGRHLRDGIGGHRQVRDNGGVEPAPETRQTDTAGCLRAACRLSNSLSDVGAFKLR
jgi:hypothetical protein